MRRSKIPSESYNDSAFMFARYGRLWVSLSFDQYMISRFFLLSLLHGKVSFIRLFECLFCPLHPHAVYLVRRMRHLWCRTARARRARYRISLLFFEPYLSHSMASTGTVTIGDSSAIIQYLPKVCLASAPIDLLTREQVGGWEIFSGAYNKGHRSTLPGDSAEFVLDAPGNASTWQFAICTLLSLLADKR